MFIKPFKIKSNILVTGSEKKRLRQRVLAQFNRSDSDTALAELFGNRTKVCTVKIVTHHEEPVTLFTSDKRPIFFELNGKLLPTVYTLWACPDLVPAFTTHPTVLPKLANGADLMIPGVVKQGTNLASWGRHERDDVVAVNLTSNRAAVGVGLLAHSSSDLYMCGGHGVCVRVMHVFGDKLWGMEPSVCQQVPILGTVVAVPKDSDFPPLVAESTKKMEEPVKELSQALDNANINSEATDSDSDSAEQPDEGEEETVPVEEDKPPTTDELIRGALLNALKLHGKKITLPLLTSTFYPQYVQPEIPEGVEMKKSSYKKVGTFFKQMAEEGLLEIREEKKGIEKVTSLNLEHPAVLSFYPYKASAKGASELDAAAAAVGGGSASNPLLLTKMTEMYAVNERTSKLFGCFNVASGKALEPTQIRNYMRDYVGRNKLIDPNTKLVTLDETLKDVCGAACGDLVALQELTETVMNSMTSTFEMKSQKGPVMKSGKRAVVHLTTATRSGNKKVTLISNLADYGINVGEFAKAVKLGAAASTTMTEVPGTKGEQLMVQGNHIKFVFELLTTTYQVPKACITGLEFAKEQKKKKKK
ncbi:eukaryotic translation initiation factor 2D [Anopheles aquasalis]|uniref:eukaryotic translation initiation factor 2D n=1 Tax=Anopheles aquasalis TaxID=42839 RepID=UPI00215A1E17|nr:eukaryotic translation initiation factor 2D [Anopheles aquasalis]